jgi:hypothetical protein
VGQAETERKFIGVSGKRICDFTRPHFIVLAFVMNLLITATRLLQNGNNYTCKEFYSTVSRCSYLMETRLKKKLKWRNGKMIQNFHSKIQKNSMFHFGSGTNA